MPHWTYLITFIAAVGLGLRVMAKVAVILCDVAVCIKRFWPNPANQRHPRGQAPALEKAPWMAPPCSSSYNDGLF